MNRKEGQPPGDWIRISEMAQMHGISRQTLILYDKKGVFSPSWVSESGYRYYSSYQIPYLREICFLRKLGFSLERIKEHMSNRNADTTVEMLTHLDEEIDRQIADLREKKEYISQRLQIYQSMDRKQKQVYQPDIQWYQETSAIYVPFEDKPEKRQALHLTLMKAWKILQQHGMIPSKGFGALIRCEKTGEEEHIYQAGSLVEIPFPEKIRDVELLTIPEGRYVTMYKYGMPYDMEPTMWLLSWIREHGYRVNGDIIDLCLLDTTFYDEDHKVDFCQLRVPIE